jgi:hypothetical protein
MGERNPHGVVDLRRAGEGGVEALAVELADEFQADRARDLPLEVATREVSLRRAADMNGERRCDRMEELLGVVVGEDDPEIGLQLAQLRADFGRAAPRRRPS